MISRESIKDYLMQISEAKPLVFARWDPVVLCGMIDTITDKEFRQLGNVGTCKTCKSWVKVSDNVTMCTSFNQRITSEDYYCADYKEKILKNQLSIFPIV